MIDPVTSSVALVLLEITIKWKDKREGTVSVLALCLPLVLAFATLSARTRLS
jgi:hypothetical protein